MDVGWNGPPPAAPALARIEQLLGEVPELAGRVERLLDGEAVLRLLAGPPQRQRELAVDHGEGGAQLVRGVGDEALLRLQEHPEPLDHGVHAAPQPHDLRVGRAAAHPRLEVAVGDAEDDVGDGLLVAREAADQPDRHQQRPHRRDHEDAAHGAPEEGGVTVEVGAGHRDQSARARAARHGDRDAAQVERTAPQIEGRPGGVAERVGRRGGPREGGRHRPRRAGLVVDCAVDGQRLLVVDLGTGAVGDDEGAAGRGRLGGEIGRDDQQGLVELALLAAVEGERHGPEREAERQQRQRRRRQHQASAQARAGPGGHDAT